MSDTLDRLIYMANQIARNLATHAHPATATADHIATYWDPRMKAMIFDHLATGGTGLDAIARDALQGLAFAGAPAHQTQGTESGGSDAG